MPSFLSKVFSIGALAALAAAVPTDTGYSSSYDSSYYDSSYSSSYTSSYSYYPTSTSSYYYASPTYTPTPSDYSEGTPTGFTPDSICVINGVVQPSNIIVRVPFDGATIVGCLLFDCPLTNSVVVASMPVFSDSINTAYIFSVATGGTLDHADFQLSLAQNLTMHSSNLTLAAAQFTSHIDSHFSFAQVQNSTVSQGSADNTLFQGATIVDVPIITNAVIGFSNMDFVTVDTAAISKSNFTNSHMNIVDLSNFFAYNSVITNTNSQDFFVNNVTLSGLVALQAPKAAQPVLINEVLL